MRDLWEKWVPRTEDYWATFSAPFRARVTEAVDKATPPGGSVMDFGCGLGVQAFLIRQRRPDVMLHLLDCNPHARNYAQILFGADDKLTIEDTPRTGAEVRTVDTMVSVFASTYLHPDEFSRILTVFCIKIPTLIFVEPTNPEDDIGAYSGMPSGGYLYPYPQVLRARGWDVEVTELEGAGALNAITVGRRP